MTKALPTYLDRIEQNPDVLVGKPVVKGTRIPVALVLGHLAHNPDLAELFAAYPHLTLEDVRACLSYAQAMVEGKRTRVGRHVPQDATAALRSA